MNTKSKVGSPIRGERDCGNTPHDRVGTPRRDNDPSGTGTQRLEILDKPLDQGLRSPNGNSTDLVEYRIDNRKRKRERSLPEKSKKQHSE